MEKIKLLNGQTFDLIPNGINQNGDSLTIRVTSDDETVENIMLMFADSESTETINVVNDEVTISSPFVGFISLDSVKLAFGEVIGQENTGTEEEPEYTNIIADVYTIVLKKEGLAEQVAQNKADIDYLAMETGVEV